MRTTPFRRDFSSWQSGEVVKAFEFFGEIVCEIRGVEFAASVLKENGWLVEACVAMDMLGKPCLDIGEVGLGEAFVEITEILLHDGEHQTHA
mgnify:CR=1 FL=1